MKLRVEDMAIAFENKKILEHVSLQVADCLLYTSGKKGVHYATSVFIRKDS